MEREQEHHCKTTVSKKGRTRKGKGGSGGATHTRLYPDKKDKKDSSSEMRDRSFR